MKPPPLTTPASTRSPAANGGFGFTSSAPPPVQVMVTPPPSATTPSTLPSLPAMVVIMSMRPPSLSGPSGLAMANSRSSMPGKLNRTGRTSLCVLPAPNVSPSTESSVRAVGSVSALFASPGMIFCSKASLRSPAFILAFSVTPILATVR